MIPITPLANNINQSIVTGGNSDLQLNQLAQSNLFLESNAVYSIANTSLLPLPSRYQGALLYVTSENRYYYSDGVEWRLDYSSVLTQPSTVMYTWGYNTIGQLGDNTTSSRTSPVTVVGGITNWRRISSNQRHKLGVTTSGVLYAWGYNGFGQLGDNTTSSRLSPVTVIGGITNWSQISAGYRHSLGLTAAGILYAWGRNDNGQLADGTTTSRSSPVTVTGGITTWNKIAAAAFGEFSFGITSAGVAYAWGNNGTGRLGDNTTTNRSSPITVVGGITSWSQIAGGLNHAVGVTTSGIAYAWGYNGQGRIGDGTTVSKSSPVPVIGGITNWSQVSAGRFSLALTSAGILYAWGRNNEGAVGDNTTSNRSSPVTVVGGITNWLQISAAENHSIGHTTNGILYAWGINTYGQLGDNTTTNRSSPVTVVGGITNWSLLSNHGAGMALSTSAALDTKGFV